MKSLWLSGKPPATFRLVPPFPRPRLAVPAVSGGIARNNLSVGGGSLPIDTEIWVADSPCEDWFSAAHGFEWLDDALAEPTNESVSKTALLIDRWIDARGTGGDDAWQPGIVGRRILNWVFAAPRLLDFAGPSFGDRFRESLFRQTRYLKHVLPNATDGADRLSALCGLAVGESVFSGDAELSKRSGELLSAELPRQVLADGGHVSRNPETHLRVLAELIELRTYLSNAQIVIPEFINNAIDRMAPMVGFFRLGDGRFAQFHGGGEAMSQTIDLVYEMSGSTGKIPGSAPHTGYERATAGDLTVIFDAAPPPPAEMNDRFHAGLLAFEVSHGGERLIVNCGARANLDDDWRLAARATAAHSTATVADTNAADLSQLSQSGAKPVAIEFDRGQSDGNHWFSATHQGYADRFGITHKRRLYIDACGTDLRGEDTFLGAGPQPFAIRFHLHPDVTATLLQDGRTALIRTKSGAGWHFKASGASLDITDSVYLGSPSMAKRCKQLVLEAESRPDASTVKWALQRKT